MMYRVVLSTDVEAKSAAEQSRRIFELKVDQSEGH